MKRSVESLLLDALASCDAVAEYIDGLSFDDYLASRLLRKGVERELELAGEALNQAAAEDDQLHDRLPDLRAVVAAKPLDPWLPCDRQQSHLGYC